MLEEKEELVLAKLIGLMNGMDEYIPDDDFKKSIMDIVLCLKEKRNYEECITMLTEYKKTYLSSCLTCRMPCGRTSDHHLNIISNDELRNARILEYQNYLNDFSLDSDFLDVAYHIGKLGW